MPQEHTIYIVDDDEAVRGALALLMKSAGLKAETYESADAFLQYFDPQVGGCLLADVRMPGMTGLELQQELVKRKIDVPVIIMTGHGDVAMAVSAMKAGAVDFIEKPFRNQDLLDKIQQSLIKADELQASHHQRAEALERLALLSNREREVMDLLVKGKLNKQIAAELDISIRTVEAHRAKIMDKLQAKSLPDVVRISLMED
ncbi:MAG: response regulator transcription factor [Gammaproteobacteria bacterium]|jgi:FixJ family two-component response regulator